MKTNNFKKIDVRNRCDEELIDVIENTEYFHKQIFNIKTRKQFDNFLEENFIFTTDQYYETLNFWEENYY